MISQLSISLLASLGLAIAGESRLIVRRGLRLAVIHSNHGCLLLPTPNWGEPVILSFGAARVLARSDYVTYVIVHTAPSTISVLHV